MFLPCNVSKNIILTIMDFKKFLTLTEEIKACYANVIVKELMLYSKALIFLGCVRIKTVHVKVV